MLYLNKNILQAFNFFKETSFFYFLGVKKSCTAASDSANNIQIFSCTLDQIREKRHSFQVEGFELQKMNCSKDKLKGK